MNRMFPEVRAAAVQRARWLEVSREIGQLRERLMRMMVVRAGATGANVSLWLNRERELEARIAALEGELEALQPTATPSDELSWSD